MDFTCQGSSTPVGCPLPGSSVRVAPLTAVVSSRASAPNKPSSLYSKTFLSPDLNFCRSWCPGFRNHAAVYSSSQTCRRRCERTRCTDRAGSTCCARTPSGRCPASHSCYPTDERAGRRHSPATSTELAPSCSSGRVSLGSPPSFGLPEPLQEVLAHWSAGSRCGKGSPCARRKRNRLNDPRGCVLLRLRGGPG